MVEIDRITYGYARTHPIFEDFSWKIQRGERWAILGPSGCGKTTLLYLMAGLRFPTQGEIRIDGQLLERPRPNTGLILQDYGLLPWATVRQNAALGISVRKFYGPDGKHVPANFQPEVNLDYWLQRLDLLSLADHYPGQLSGGQRQRTAIARTLVLRPDLLLMDEPFASLDAPTREDLQNLILTLHSEAQLTLVIVTHAIEEAALLGSKILVLKQPPIRQGLIIDNPEAFQAGFRHSLPYLRLCQDLRRYLEAA